MWYGIHLMILLPQIPFWFGEGNLLYMIFGKIQIRRTSVHLMIVILAEAPLQEKQLYLDYTLIPIETEKMQCKKIATKIVVTFLK